MAGVLEKLDEIVWSICTYTPKELSSRSKCFPILVKVAECISGECFYKFSVNQVLYLHSIQEQFRFLAQDSNENEISIPINSPVNFLEPDSRDVEVVFHEDMTLPRYIKISLRHSKHDLSQLICLTEEDKIILNVKQRGWMKYLLGLCLSKDGVSNCTETVPIDCCEIRFCVGLDLRNQSIDDFSNFESCLTDLVHDSHQHKLDHYQGNADFIINAQPNFIEVLAEIITDTNLQLNVSDKPLHDKSKDKGFKDKIKKKKKKRKPSYTKINISKVESMVSKYQDLVSASSSTDEYDYPYFDDDYEMIDENPQLQNDDLTIYKPLSLKDAIQPTYENGHLQSNNRTPKVLSMDGEDNGDYLIPIQHGTIIQKVYRATSLEEYLVPMKQGTIVKSQDASEDSSGYLVPMKEGANTKDKKQMPTVDVEENKDGYLVLEQETRMMKTDETSLSEDDKEYFIPMKQRANTKDKKHVTTLDEEEDEDGYLVPTGQETRMTKSDETSLSEDDKEYFIPIKQRANGKDKMTTVDDEEEDEDGYLIPTGQEMRMTKTDENLLSEDVKEYLIPIKQRANAKYKLTTVDEDSSVDNNDNLIPKKHEDDAKNKKKKVKKRKKKKKEHLLETSQHQTQQHHGKDKQIPFVHPLSQSQDTCLEKVQEQRKLYKETGHNVMKILSESHKKLQSCISAINLISQSKKLKPTTVDEDNDEDDYLLLIEQETNLMTKTDETWLLEDDKEHFIQRNQETNMQEQTHISSVDNNDNLIPKKHEDDAKNKKKKVKKRKKKKKEHLLETSQHQTQQHHGKDKQIPFVHPLSQNQDTGLEKVQEQRKLYKETGHNVMKILPESHKKLQSCISAIDLISQSKKLKPTMLFPEKRDRVSESRKAVTSESMESIQCEISTHNKAIEGSVSNHNIFTHNQESLVENDVENTVKPMVPPKPTQIRDCSGKTISSHRTEDIKSSKIMTKPLLLPKPRKK